MKKLYTAYRYFATNHVYNFATLCLSKESFDNLLFCTSVFREIHKFFQFRMHFELCLPCLYLLYFLLLVLPSFLSLTHFNNYFWLDMLLLFNWLRLLFRLWWSRLVLQIDKIIFLNPFILSIGE